MLSWQSLKVREVKNVLFRNFFLSILTSGMDLAGFNPLMTGRGGGVRLDATFTNRLFEFFSQEWEEFLQTKFLAAASSFGHLSMKNFFRLYLPSGSGNHPPLSKR